MRDELGALAARYAERAPAGRGDAGRGGRGGATPPRDLDDAELIERARAMIAQGQSTRDAARELAALTGRPRRDVYKLITSARG